MHTCVRLFVTLSTVAHQASLSMEFSRQEYWNGLSFPTPGSHPNPGIEPVSPVLTGKLFTTVPAGKPQPPITWGFNSHCWKMHSLSPDIESSSLQADSRDNGKGYLLIGQTAIPDKVKAFLIQKKGDCKDRYWVVSSFISHSFR